MKAVGWPKLLLSIGSLYRRTFITKQNEQTNKKKKCPKVNASVIIITLFSYVLVIYQVVVII